MAEKVLNTKILLRQDSTTNWNNNSSIVLSKGEVGIEFCDTNAGRSGIRTKIGDGVTTWGSLAYHGGESIASSTAPSTSDINYNIGTIWVNTSSNIPYILISNSPTANWRDLSAVTIPVTDVTVDGTSVLDGTIAKITKSGLGITALETNMTAAQGAIANIQSNEQHYVPDTRKVAGIALGGDISAANLKTALSLNNVTNDKQVVGLASGTTANNIVVWGSNGYTVADGGYSIANIIEIAEGRTATYVIANKSAITGTETPSGDFNNVTAITGVDMAKLKVGDIVLVEAGDQPDYWVSAKTSGNVATLKKFETKIDLSEYQKKQLGSTIAGATTVEGALSNLASYFDANGVALEANHALISDNADHATVADSANSVAGANVTGTVANATNAVNVNLTATGNNSATISINAGTGTAASFTVNNVANATYATTAGSADSVAAANVTGVLPVAHGGTGASSLTADAVLVGNGTGAVKTISKGSANGASTIVQRDSGGNFSACTITANLSGTATNATKLNGQDASYYTNATNIATGTLSADRLPVVPLSKGGTGTVLANGTSGQVLTSNGNGGVLWSTPSSDVTDVQIAGTSITTSGIANITKDNLINLNNDSDTLVLFGGYANGAWA